MSKKTPFLFSFFLIITSAFLVASPGYGHEGSDHARARQALLAGDVLPLSTVLDRIEQSYPGKPVKIEFEEDDGVYIYEIKLLQDSGNMIKLKVDAKDARIILVRTRRDNPREDN